MRDRRRRPGAPVAPSDGLNSPVRRIIAGVAAAITVAGLVLAAAPSQADSTSSSAVTATKTVTRVHINADGTRTTAESDKISLTVGQTQQLRGREQIQVSWSGAHPTGAINSRVNSAKAANYEEYPFVLLECRGTAANDSTAVSPQACWTNDYSERFQSSISTAYPPYRLDASATPADRAVRAGDPGLPSTCRSRDLAEHWVPLLAADGTVYDETSTASAGNGCGSLPPEASAVDTSGLPSNDTYGITQTDGRGSTQFDITTHDENATLGCGPTVPCALVAIPILGIGCDGTTPGASADDLAECRASGNYPPGSHWVNAGLPSAAAVTGALWWSASNWNNRIVVPLTFAADSSVCDGSGVGTSVSLYGSLLLTEATSQWEPAFCTDPTRFNFTHVQAGDVQARELLETGQVEGAFSSRAPDQPFSTPTVQAPVAVTGFSVSYTIDDANGQPYTSLRLTPRLIAKLLSESYWAIPDVRNADPGIAHNPQNITTDPEFIALNPGLPQLNAADYASTLLTLSTQTDLTWALTSYINADPQARAFLDGKPDPWGMVVNPAYLKIALPVTTWPLNDETTLPDEEQNPCYENSPSPYLALIASPTQNLQKIVESLEFSIANSQTFCAYDDVDPSTLKLTTAGTPQSPGNRFLIGITSLSEAQRYSLRSAALETSDNTDETATHTGGTFVAPTDDALSLAAQTLVPDDPSGTWLLPYSTLGSTAIGRQAYPGTMLVYADVPTSGITNGDAPKLATLLRFAATDGQTPGLGNGQLPPGYLPMNAVNGLSNLVTYTQKAAAAVADQVGFVPTPSGQEPVVTPVPTEAGDAAASTLPVTVNGSTPVVAPSQVGAISLTAPATTPTAGAPATTGRAAAVTPAASAGVTGSITSVVGRLILPLLSVLLLLAALAAPVVGRPELLRHPGLVLTSLFRPLRPSAILNDGDLR